jgi:hypothetical protein
MTCSGVVSHEEWGAVSLFQSVITSSAELSTLILSCAEAERAKPMQRLRQRIRQTKSFFIIALPP